MSRAKPISADEQYQLILECRSSGLSDYQWCTEYGINPGTFYNWVKRLRKKACYDIPEPAGRSSYKPQAVQEIVPLLIVDDEKPQSPIVSEVEHNTRIRANETSFAAELIYNGISVRISNDIRKDLLYTIFSCLGGSTC